jgi:hypothetical protein
VAHKEEIPMRGPRDRHQDDLLAALDAFGKKYAHLSGIESLRAPGYLDEFWGRAQAEMPIHAFVAGLFAGGGYAKDLDEATALIHDWYENECQALGAKPVLAR